MQIQFRELWEIALDQVPKKWQGKDLNPGRPVYPGLTDAGMPALCSYQMEDVDFPLQLWNPHLA